MRSRNHLVRSRDDRQEPVSDGAKKEYISKPLSSSFAESQIVGQDHIKRSYTKRRLQRTQQIHTTAGVSAQQRASEPSSLTADSEFMRLASSSDALQMNPLQRQLQLSSSSSSLIELNTDFLWRYAGAMIMLLISFVAYLLTPKGFRKAYGRANRKRYPRRRPSMEAVMSARPRSQQQKVNISIPRIHKHSQKEEDESTLSSEDEIIRQPHDDDDDNTNDELDEFSNQRAIASARASRDTVDVSPNDLQLREKVRLAQQPTRRNPVNLQRSLQSAPARLPPTVASFNTTKHATLTLARNRSSPSTQRHQRQERRNKTPIASPATAYSSFHHPGVTTLPRATVLDDTLSRLESNGIRLLAHGVQCDPKRVWIRIQPTHDNEAEQEEAVEARNTAYSLVWQTEFPRSITNSLGEQSVVLMRGGLHKIELASQVVLVDVGKKTAALQKSTSRHVPASACFSILTTTGSLDLQANSSLERDALVSCISKLLDDAKGHGDWRQLYQTGGPLLGAAATTAASSVCLSTESQRSVVTDNMSSEVHVSFQTSWDDTLSETDNGLEDV